eukprot:TRINITY_DN103860_c0_g1_i1.p1 TRINITY_DN103860_c0_g1~~TRINITY_DN103860_c0_g1_i1.p1  ORF type:complete len:358 (+),score=76.04 TRINITY_DN103860_c0_g1_i1:69-1142(+)
MLAFLEPTSAGQVVLNVAAKPNCELTAVAAARSSLGHQFGACGASLGQLPRSASFGVAAAAGVAIGVIAARRAPLSKRRRQHHRQSIYRCAVDSAGIAKGAGIGVNEVDEAAEDLPTPPDPSLEALRFPLGPGKGDIIAFQKKASEEETNDLQAIESGDKSQEEVMIKHIGRLAGTGNGWTVFPASGFFAQFLVNCPSFVKNQVVVEVGCGCGVSGIAAAKAGAKEVLLMDKDPTVLEIARHNVEANGVADKVRLLEMDWAERDTWPNPLPACDVIIGSDVLFNPHVHKDLANVLEAMLPEHGRALLVDPRQRVTRPPFLELCRDCGFEVGTLFETKEMLLINLMPLTVPDIGGPAS